MILRRVMAALVMVGLAVTGPAVTTIELPYRNALEYAIHGVGPTGRLVPSSVMVGLVVPCNKRCFPNSGCEFAYEKVDDLDML